MGYITIVTGTSGAGKSTLKNEFAEMYGSRYTVYDFDDVGVPEIFPENWRQDTTAHRMSILQKHQARGEPVVLFGQIVPDEIVGAKDDILFIFLDAPWDQIQSRLRNRGRSEELIQTYQSRDTHIKQSVQNQKHHLVLSTQQSIQVSLQQLYKYIQQRTTNKTL